MNERETRLTDINAQLTARGLKPLRKLGDQTKGEIEAIRVVEIFEHSKRFFTDVKLAVVFPGGPGTYKEGEYTIRFNANGEVSDGAVIVVLVNGRFAIVKQWRLTVGQWTYEIPRGFGEKLDKAQVAGSLGTIKIADLPLATLTRELGEEVMAQAEITSVTHLGNVAENSGTHAVAPSYFLVQLEVEPEKLDGKLKGTEDMKVYLWDAAEIDRQLGVKIVDSHSIVAIALAKRYIERLPQMKAAEVAQAAGRRWDEEHARRQ